MKLFPLFVALAYLLFGLPAAFSAPAADSAIHLVILHINDTHGRLFPHMAFRGSVGGAARLATLVSRIRAETKGPVLLLHAGDILSRGDSLTTFFGGEPDFKIMDHMKFDALTPGNGDYYMGLNNLLRLRAMVHFPFLEANLFYRSTDSLIFPPYCLKNVDGIAIAILGLGTIHEELESSRSLLLRDPLKTAVALGPELRQKADIVIALTHIGLPDDSYLAAYTPFFDFMVGGHTHDELDTGLMVVRSDRSGKTLVVQAGSYGEYLGKIDVMLSKNDSGWRILSAQAKLIAVDGTIPEDTAVNGILFHYGRILDSVLLVSAKPLPHGPKGKDPMGDLVAQSVKIATGADIAVLDRAAVGGGLKAGPVTLADIYRIYPWRNNLVLLKLKGVELPGMLLRPDIIAGGITVEKKDSTIRLDGKLLDPGRSYRIATTSFLVDDTPEFQLLPQSAYEKDITPTLIRFIKDASVSRN